MIAENQQTNQFVVHWIDDKREPKCVPDLRYPNGVDIDVTQGQTPCCTAALLYPAPRCGYYYVECRKCGANALITTAGRMDDPRSLKLRCKSLPHEGRPQL